MIDLIIDKRTRDLGGGFEVGRVLPFAKRRMVGPFIFFDQMGPVEFAPASRANLTCARIRILASRPSPISIPAR